VVEITKIFEFAAAHHLPYHKGLCKNPHGHNFRLEVSVTRPIQKEGPERGMVMDFGNLKRMIKKAILDEFDHCNLNSLFDNPTAEIMAKAFARQVQLYLGDSITVVKLRLWETSTSCATWRKE